MKKFSLNNQEFTAYEFDEIKANPGRIVVKSIKCHNDELMTIEKENGFRLIFRRGDYLTVWKDGDILTGSKKYIDEHAKNI